MDCYPRAQGGQLEAARVLLSAGASVNRCDKFGSTPLHTACRRGDEVIHMNLTASHDGPSLPSTIIPRALLNNLYLLPQVMVRLLIDHKADLTVVNKQGFTPIECAFRYGNATAGILRSLRFFDPRTSA